MNSRTQHIHTLVPFSPRTIPLQVMVLIVKNENDGDGLDVREMQREIRNRDVCCQISDQGNSISLHVVAVIHLALGHGHLFRTTSW